MDIRIAGRHLEITDALRNHINGGLAKFENHFDKAVDVDVVLTVEKQRQIAEVNMHANGLRINAKGTSEDMYTSIDSALQKIGRQADKHRDRINRHQPRTARETRDYTHHVLEVAEMDTVDEGASENIEVGHKVVQREQLPMRPLSVEDAIFQLELQEDLFVVFTNAETQRVNVLYRHGDGTLGLIEPPY
jgi:putative sigma-54 modulation protein